MRTNTEYNVYCLVLGGLILVPRLSPWPGGMPTPNFPITSKKIMGKVRTFSKKKYLMYENKKTLRNMLIVYQV